MKKILVMLGFVAASVAANASYLYWQVADTEFNGHSIDAVSIRGESTFTNIYYYDVNTGTQSPVYNVNGMVAANPNATYVIDLGDTDYDSSYAFYIELYNYDSSSSFTNIGYTTETYDNLVQKGYVSSTLTTIPAAWTGSSSTPGGPSYNVPEPTSALMMLIGLAGIALKRKRV